MVGICLSNAPTNKLRGQTVDGWGYYQQTGQSYTNNVLAGYGATWTNGDIIGIAYDATAGSLTFYKNNVSQGVAFTEISGAMYVIISSYRSTAQTAVMTIALATIEQTYAPPAT